MTPKRNLPKGPSINVVSSEGEGGGPPSKPIYYISLFSNLSQQGEGGGRKFGKMGRRHFWMARNDSRTFSNLNTRGVERSKKIGGEGEGP